MAEDIVARYIADVQSALANLQKLQAANTQVGTSAQKGAATADQAFNKMADNIGSQFKALGASMAAAFALDRIVSFTQEAVKLAGKIEGVKVAFNRLGDPKLLDGLRAATKGTVSDLNLMTAAVRANNFKIPMEQLGTLLEFARRRAKETGESIDYLVESIVVGIGRKSPLILDNLGISAVELRKRFGDISVEAAEVGDVAKIVGDIATEELAKMGTEAETTGDLIAKMGADWENVTAEIGKATIQALKFFATVAQGAEGEKASTRAAIDDWAKHDAAVRDAYYNIQNAIADTSDKEAQLAAFREGRANAEIELLKLTSKEQRNANEIALNLAQKRLDAAVGFNVIDQLAARENLKNTEKDIENQYRREQILKAVIDLYDKYINGPQKAETEATKEQIRNVFFLTKAIADLEDEQKQEGTTRERVREITAEIIPLQKELDELLGKQAKTVENSAKALKELKDRLSDLTTMTATGIPGLRQFAVDGAGINNSLNTLNESLAQARKQLGEAPIGSTVFKQAQKDVEDLEAAIKRATNDQIDPAKGWLGVSSGIADEAANARGEMEKQAQEFNDFISVLNQMFFDSMSLGVQIQSEMQAQAIQYEMDLIEQKFKKGELTQKQYEIRQTQLRRKAAQQQKDTATFNVIIATASAIMNALQTNPFVPVGLAMAAFAGITGAAQIAAIQSAPLPQFAEGGWVSPDGWIEGRKHSTGGVKLEAEGGEFIVNARQANKYADILEAINRDRFDAEQVRGWADLSKSIDLNGMGGNGFNDLNLISAIDRHRESDSRGMDKLANALLKAVKLNNNARTRWS